ncbi:hypothetical protein [Palaeococcus ferrophilus]|uniref:hypothetical protein n=1 Tax=Palaeococcus ferrophilus TaxID=83868 RepID=UPI00064E8DDD|nr:hypothetical protein [Palaeococcus ferrophilus]
MEVKVPFLVFEVNGEEYAIDAHFSRRLSRVERISTLIRKRNFPESLPAGSLEALLGEDELEDFLKALYMEVAKLAGERIDDRMRHMRRWNLSRLLGLPTGFFRHVKEDEELAEKSREAMLSLAILKKVLGVKSAADLGEVKVTVKGLTHYRISVDLEKGEVLDEKGKKDAVYSALLKMDEGFRRALIGEKKRG